MADKQPGANGNPAASPTLSPISAPGARSKMLLSGMAQLKFPSMFGVQKSCGATGFPFISSFGGDSCTVYSQLVP